MAVGKKTGGRQKGTRNKATARREKEIAKGGDTPLEYMLKVMRNPKADASRRDDMAKAAAPYVHPKLAAHQHTGRDGGPVSIELTGFSFEQLKQFEDTLSQLATAAGGDAAAGQGGDSETDR